MLLNTIDLNGEGGRESNSPFRYCIKETKLSVCLLYYIINLDLIKMLIFLTMIN